MAILANGQKIDYIPAPDNYIIHKSTTVALNRSIPIRQKIKAIRMDGFYFLVNDGVRKTNRKTDTISIYKIGYAAFSGMGISHGLKTCHRHVFLTAFRFPYGKK